MRSKKLRRQISKYLDYEDLELDLTEIIDWINKPDSIAPVRSNVLKVFENFQYFLDSIDSSYEQLESNLNHAQRSLEISGSELEERNKLLRQENKKVSSLLNNMKQAVFAVRQDGTIVAPVSKHSQILFGEDIVSKNVFQLLFKDLDENSEKFSLLKSAFISVFGENDLQWFLMEDQFPDTINIKINNFDRTLKIATQPMWDERERLEKIMFLIEDITELVELNKKLHQQQTISAKRTEVLQELTSISRKNIHIMISKLIVICKKIDSLVSDIKFIDDNNYKLIFSDLHTIKGNARVLGLKQLASKAHDTESFLTIIKDSHDEILHHQFIEIHLKSFFDFASIYIDLYNDFFVMENKIFNGYLSKDWIESKLINIKGKISSEVYNDIVHLLSHSKLDQKSELEEFLREIIKNTSQKCNKEVEFVFSSIDFLVDDVSFEIIENSLLHIIQNAIDHGIEEPQERLKNNKEIKGRIEVNIEMENQNILVKIKDDGIGIDKEKLLIKAKSSGFTSSPGENVLSLIFKSGFSTKEKISEISGRGVGLDSVSIELSKINGQVEVSSQLKKGTEFKIIIPPKAS